MVLEVLGNGEENHNRDGTVTYTFHTPEAATAGIRFFGRLLILQR
ncbi:MAG: hypothetical protein ABF380_03620 [Akkermansiaceae bacterium]